jgi:Ca-activated chloride channel family protein
MTAAITANAQAILVPRRHRIDAGGSHSVQQDSHGSARSVSGDTAGASAREVNTRQPAKPADEAAGSTEQATPAEPLPAALPVSAININIHISGQVATVTVSHIFTNDTDDLLEGTYYFPVPQGASLEEFAVYDGRQRRVGRVKEKEQARADYAAAVGQGQDPAILEMTRSGWFQSHVYPIPPHAGKQVEIIYSQVLGAKDGAITFDYPLGQGYKKLKVPVGSVAIELDLKASSAINNVFSPTHPLDVNYDGDRHATATVITVGGGDAENFRLQYSLSDADVGLSLITYRKQGQDGYFLLMLSPKVEFDASKISAKDVLFVIDTSGSMEGSKIAQAKEALMFGLAHTLAEHDRFNIISFNSTTRPMQPGLIPATRSNIDQALQFVSKLTADGGTDINTALITAMQMFEPGSRPKNIVFLTDGRPENGITDANLIAANVRAANGSRVRLFAFGVGSDVNRVLLERLAADNRGVGRTSTTRHNSGAPCPASSPKSASRCLQIFKSILDRFRLIEFIPRNCPTCTPGRRSKSWAAIATPKT